jgi:hypothetical protein
MSTSHVTSPNRSPWSSRPAWGPLLRRVPRAIRAMPSSAGYRCPSGPCGRAGSPGKIRAPEPGSLGFRPNHSSLQGRPEVRGNPTTGRATATASRPSASLHPRAPYWMRWSRAGAARRCRPGPPCRTDPPPRRRVGRPQLPVLDQALTGSAAGARWRACRPRRTRWPRGRNPMAVSVVRAPERSQPCTADSSAASAASAVHSGAGTVRPVMSFRPWPSR